MFKGLSYIYVKSLLLFLPLLIILLSFLFLDPFGIVYLKNSAYETSGDYQTTKLYLNNTKQVNYNSFIFGNSKTLAFRSEDWKRHVQGDFYKFGAPGESIFNIYNKIKLIEKEGDTLKNALLVIDLAMINNYMNKSPYLQGPVYKHHPYTQDESWLTFYGSFFKYYLTDGFFVKVIKESFLATPAVVEKTDFLKTQDSFDPSTTEFYLSALEKEIQDKGFFSYYQNHASEFKTTPTRTNSEHLPNLNEGDKNHLFEIKQVFDNHHCNYKLIIGPVLNGPAFPKNILNDLKNIFGAASVYDYSNTIRISRDSSYYYEQSHYRPIAGALILDEIYSSKAAIER